MKYIKKPVIIEAVIWTGKNVEEIDAFVKGSEKMYDFVGDGLYIHTLEGSMRASVGDYIIKGIKDEFYPCKPDIFKLTYTDADSVGDVSIRCDTFNELCEALKNI